MAIEEEQPKSKILELFRANPPNLAPYEDVYRHIHAHPELSLQEQQTAANIAKHEALADYKVHTSIGGHGVAGVLSNGNGPTVLLRADMDALPVKEETGLEYASKTKSEDGQHVMHACGHDMHVACLLAAAAWMAREDVRQNWSGTLVVVFQPNEERGQGAKAMVDGGLYDKVPKPDVLLAQHVMPLRSGSVAVRKGIMIASADSFKITLFGRGGHGSMPQLCIDPVVLASTIVLRLQGVVSREIDPQDVAVLTVGSLQAGETENVIASQAVLKVDIRAENSATREKLQKAMKRIVIKECEASGCEKAPEFERTRTFPLTENDSSVTQKLSDTFGNVFGNDFDPDTKPATASEDFSDLATSIDRPYCFWMIGGVDGDKWDQAEKDGRIAEDIPANHSGLFAPVIQPTLKVGCEAMCAAALTYLMS